MALVRSVEQRHQTVLDARAKESEAHAIESETRAREYEVRARECEVRANERERDYAAAANELLRLSLLSSLDGGEETKNTKKIPRPLN